MSGLLWIAPEASGGIRNYSDILFPSVQSRLSEARLIRELPESFSGMSETLIHLQHEYGLFGSKLPGRYLFPKWIRHARAKTPGKKWVATAHTVIDQKWKYRAITRGWRKLAYSALNHTVVPLMRKKWLEETWGALDGVIVHSELQAEAIRESGCPKVAVIPHFVPKLSPLSFEESKEPTVVLFGYFSPEKGQDLAIDAWAKLGSRAPRLILAGGTRRKADTWYRNHCLNLIQKLRLGGKIEVTGFIPGERVESIYRRANLVLAPFRETNGSGSLALGLGFGAPILASNLPLNVEIDQRTPGSIATFDSGSSDSLASAIERLTRDPAARKNLRESALSYAKEWSPDRVVDLHLEFYRSIGGDL